MRQTKKKQKKQVKQQDYLQVLCDYFNTGKPILSKKGNELIIADDEIFVPCYADTPTRHTFPKYWFISQYDHLISTWNKRVTWLEPCRCDNDNISYKYSIKLNNEAHIKTIQTHNLVGLVFGSEVYGKAKALLDEQGVYAFGVKQKGIIKVNGHHKDGNHANNTPNNIQFITTDVHILLDKIPKANTTEAQELDLMRQFARLAEQENPNKPTIIWTDERYDRTTGEPLASDNSISIHSINRVSINYDTLTALLEAIYE